MLQDKEIDADAEVAWSIFDHAAERRAETRPQLAEKLRLALWALTERECEEEAARMINSALIDLERASD